MYVDDLIVGLSSEHIGYSIDTVYINNINYADAMVLLCPLVGTFRRLLSICEKYASERGLLRNGKRKRTLCSRPPDKGLE